MYLLDTPQATAPLDEAAPSAEDVARCEALTPLDSCSFA